MLKAFVEEKGSSEVIALLERTQDQLKSASALAQVELRSAIRRRQLLSDISRSEADFAVELVREEARRMILHPVAASVLELSISLIDRRGIRTLDAIQLATAIAIKTSATPEQSFCFVASDHRLLAAAEAEGLRVWDPAMTAFEDLID